MEFPSHSYIEFDNSSLESIERVLKAYFDNEWIGHPAFRARIQKHPDEPRFLLTFEPEIENQLFVFFFTSIFADEEFPEGSFRGWFWYIGERSPDYQSPPDAEEEPLFHRYVFLERSTEEYTLGFTAEGERMEFDWGWDIQLSSGEGYRNPDFDPALYSIVCDLHFSAKKSKMDKGCLFGFPVLALAGIILTL